jgi:hypothetical protein
MEEKCLMKERRTSGGPVSCGVGLRLYIVEQLYSKAQRVITSTHWMNRENASTDNADDK